MRYPLRIVLFGSVLAISTVGCGVDATAPPATLQSITLVPANPSIAPGTTIQLSAAGKYSNNSTSNISARVVWDSSDSTVASVSNAAGSQGLVTAGSMTGTAVISAAYSGINGSTVFSSSPVAVLMVSPSGQTSIAPGTNQQFSATATLDNSATQNLTTWATWTTTDPSIAAVSNNSGSKGLATALTAGSTTVEAVYSGVTGSAVLVSSHVATITTAPATASIAEGNSLQFTANSILANGSTQDLTAWATWSSSNTSVATFYNTSGQGGLLLAVGTGTTLVTALYDSITSSPASTCTVTPAVVTAIAVTPASASVPLGKKQQFKAEGTFSDASKQDITTSATWNTSNSGVAAISNTSGTKGLATPKAVGSVSITASLSGITSNSAALTVKAAELASILVTPLTAQIIISQSGLNPFKQYTATGTYTDGSVQDITTSVTWSSSNMNAATISNSPGSEGLAAPADLQMPANEIRITNITATLAGITSNSATLTVSQFQP